MAGRQAADLDLSTTGPGLAPEWAEAGKTVCGVLHAPPSTPSVAAAFVSAGWRSRKSSWYGYEVETSWCRIDLDPIEGPATLLDGLVDPAMFDALATLLAEFGPRFSLEMYGEDGDLLCETAV
ncbi:hypothetical protein OHT61_17685 [Streptomyces sp. NBC_00178]|uniref:hypothetical protein n=1 Tax=Streptomyces sp. NBC_00178 TaxID=2975672 RepID=UPI002E29ACBA|nr:hypothetical protein [Streptomyces sp. NBC_00178]